MKFNSSCSGCFAGLSCDSRVNIIELLQKNGTMSVLEIAKHFKLTQPTITHHLKFLKDVGILKSIKKGKLVFYSIHPDCKDEECHIFT